MFYPGVGRGGGGGERDVASAWWELGMSREKNEVKGPKGQCAAVSHLMSRRFCNTTAQVSFRTDEMQLFTYKAFYVSMYRGEHLHLTNAVSLCNASFVILSLVHID